MYATIRRFELAGRTGAELIPEGRRLATAVSKEHGFIAYALLEATDGAIISISVFEEPDGLARGDALVEQWVAQHGLEPSPGDSEVRSGEVIVQKGI